MTAPVPRVAVVEDDPRFRYALKSLLAALPELGPAALFAAAEPALAAAERAHRRGDGTPWDLVLMDLGLPGAGGIEATGRLKALFPELKIVALTTFDEPHSVLGAICAGIDGYISKQAEWGELAEQLRLVLRNGAALSPRLAGTVLKLVRLQGRSEAGDPARGLALSARQIDVLRALAEGGSYREIGETLDMSIDTVRTHIRRIYAALQVKSAAQAVSKAIGRGLI
jgi:DNA-binding NarL/FixJ family response regulator